jgi:hypothetical protein
MPSVGAPTEPSDGDTIEKVSEANNSLRSEPERLPRYFERWGEDSDKEVVAVEDGKEVAPPDGLESFTFSDEKHVVAPEHEKETFLGFPQQLERRKKICGMRKRSFLLVGTLIVCCLVLTIVLILNLRKTK